MKLSDAAAAKALQVSRGTIAIYKQRGAPYIAAIACTALCHDLPAWGSIEMDKRLERVLADLDKKAPVTAAPKRTSIGLKALPRKG